MRLVLCTQFWVCCPCSLVVVSFKKSMCNARDSVIAARTTSSNATLVREQTIYEIRFRSGSSTIGKRSEGKER